MFLRSLEDVAGEEQGMVCLQCEASKETVSPVWKKDGVVLTPSDKQELLHSGRSMTLILHSLCKDDTGHYTCDLGTSQTKAKVTVHGEYEHIVQIYRTTFCEYILIPEGSQNVDNAHLSVVVFY